LDTQTEVQRLKHNACCRTWRSKNREKQAELRRAWAVANPEKIREYSRVFYASAAGRDYYRNYKHQSSALARAIAESLITLFEILPHDGWRRQLAAEIVNSDSGQTLGWASARLEDHLVAHTNY
jgi:hypothetical protein